MQIGFRIRGEGRDRQTDTVRFTRLLSMLDELEAGVLSEKFGLQQRYESASVTAAFAQQYYEDEAQNAALSERIDGLTQSLKEYTRRIESLQRQVDLIEQLRASTQTFAEGCGLNHVAGAPPSHARH